MNLLFLTACSLTGVVQDVRMHGEAVSEALALRPLDVSALADAVLSPARKAVDEAQGALLAARDGLAEKQVGQPTLPWGAQVSNAALLLWPALKGAQLGNYICACFPHPEADRHGIVIACCRQAKTCSKLMNPVPLA